MEPDRTPTFVDFLETSAFVDASDLVPEPGDVTDVCAICFIGERLVLVRAAADSPWDLVMDEAHPHETVQEATERVVQQRICMKGTMCTLLGYLVVPTDDGDALVACSSVTVEPDGVHTPDTEGPAATMKVVELSRVRDYLPWTSRLSVLLHRANAEHPSIQSGL
ncbi:MAG TPA: hypothetical protein VF439_00855 [Candidatus Paceibacterota bacterium]